MGNSPGIQRPPSVADLGRVAKEHWSGQFDHVPDEELGRLVKQQWPGQFEQFLPGVPGPPTPTEISTGIAGKAAEYVPTPTPDELAADLPVSGPTPGQEQAGFERLGETLTGIGEAAKETGTDVLGAPPLPTFETPAGQQAFERQQGPGPTVERLKQVAGASPEMLFPEERLQFGLPGGPTFEVAPEVDELAREVASMINPGNVAAIYALGGADKFVRAAVRHPKVAAALADTPRMLQLLQGLGDVFIPGTIGAAGAYESGLATEQAIEAYQRGDRDEGARQFAKAVTAGLVGAAGGVGAATRLRVGPEQGAMTAPEPAGPQTPTELVGPPEPPQKIRGPILDEIIRGMEGETPPKRPPKAPQKPPQRPAPKPAEAAGLRTQAETPPQRKPEIVQELEPPSEKSPLEDIIAATEGRPSIPHPPGETRITTGETVRVEMGPMSETNRAALSDRLGGFGAVLDPDDEEGQTVVEFAKFVDPDTAAAAVNKALEGEPEPPASTPEEVLPSVEAQEEQPAGGPVATPADLVGAEQALPQPTAPEQEHRGPREGAGVMGQMGQPPAVQEPPFAPAAPAPGAESAALTPDELVRAGEAGPERVEPGGRGAGEGDVVEPGRVTAEGSKETLHKTPPGTKDPEYLAKAQRLADAYRQARREMPDQPLSWQDFTKIADQAFGGSIASGAYSSRDAYDALELAEQQRLADKYGRNPGNEPSDIKSFLPEIAKAGDLLPTQTARTREQVKFQQFSTPPPHSYVMNWLADVGPKDRVLEPSAGTGSQAVWAKARGAKVHVNEISDRRADLLRTMGFDEVTQHDAEQINNILQGKERPTVVVMNPPFSAAGHRGKARDTMIGARHVEQALKRLAPGGRLVALVGRGMEFGKPKFEDWWRRILKEYNVRANVSVSGKLYTKYGTSFNNQILVIDKVAPTGDKPVQGQFDSLEEVVDALATVQKTRPERVGAEPARAPTGGRAGEPGVSRPASGKPEPGGPVASPSDLAGVTAEPEARPAREGNGKPAEPAAATPDELVSGTDTEPRADRPARPSATERGGKPKQEPERPVEPESAVAAPPSNKIDDEHKREDGPVYTEYEAHPQVKGFSKHPGVLVESKSMAAVERPTIRYQHSLPKNTDISAVQAESVLLAGQRHEQRLANGARAGFLLGDGTGVGKGRTLASIALDNWEKGHRRMGMFSVSKDLMEDFLRDLRDVAGKDHPLTKSLVDLGKTTGDKIEHGDGIVFSTYSTLISKVKKKDKQGRATKDVISRYDQLKEWLGDEPVLLFDEAHAAKNVGEGDAEREKKKGSQRAAAVTKIQDDIPQARVVYSSATGATVIENMAYMTRMGLWGLGTSFPGGFQGFMAAMQEGGVGAMEMVARDLKALGGYVSRTISFDGVEYDELAHETTPHQKEMYDAAAKIWQILFQNMEKALKETDSGGRERAFARSAFYGAQQRFFKALITSFKIPTMLADIEKVIDSGGQAVVSLIGTGEMLTEKIVNEALSEGADINDLDFTPKQSLINYLNTAFPVQQFEEVEEEGGDGRTHTVRRPVKDADGNPVMNADAVAMRDKVIDLLGEIKIPMNPLDQLIIGLDKKYPGKVAELTGRKKRLAEKRNQFGAQSLDYVARKKSKGSKSVNIGEMREFQAGDKLIAIISDAASTGISLHSDRRAKSQRKRTHFILELGWSADKQMQNFGRTHRSNQANSPTYKLVNSDIGGEKRFSSTIAKRLASLGALTKGQRDATGSGDLSKYNFESQYGTAAVDALYRHMEMGGTFPGIENGRQVLHDMGLITPKQLEEGGGVPDKWRKGDKAVTTFLNRVMALEFDRQNAVFNAFMAYFEKAVENAKASGEFDDGVMDLKARSVKVLESNPIHRDQLTGAPTYHVRVEAEEKTDPVSWNEVRWPVQEGRGKFFKNKKTGKWAMMQISGHRMDEQTGRVFNTYSVWKPEAARHSYIKEEELKEKWEMSKAILDKDLKPIKEWWEEALNNIPQYRTVTYDLISGLITPLWKELRESRASRLKVMRVTSDDGQRVVGIAVPKTQVGKILAKLGVFQRAQDPKGVFDLVISGGTVDLKDGLRLARRNFRGSPAIQVLNPKSAQFRYLRTIGAIEEITQFTPKFFIPTEARKGIPVLEQLLKQHPQMGEEKEGPEPEAQQQPSGKQLRATIINGYPVKVGVLDSGDYLFIRGVQQFVMPSSEIPSDVKRAGFNGLHQVAEIIARAATRANVSGFHGGGEAESRLRIARKEDIEEFNHGEGVTLYGGLAGLPDMLRVATKVTKGDVEKLVRFAKGRGLVEPARAGGEVVGGIGRSYRDKLFGSEDADLGAWVRKWHTPRFIAERNPQFMPLFNRALAFEHQRHALAQELFEILRPYFDLDSKLRKKLDNKLIHARFTRDEDLDWGAFTPEQKKEAEPAFNAVRAAMHRAFDEMQNLAVDLASDGRVTDANAIQSPGDARKLVEQTGLKDELAAKQAERLWDVLEELRKVKVQGYVPFTRFGNWRFGFVDTKDPGGSIWEHRTNAIAAHVRWQKFKKTHAKKLKNPRYKFRGPHEITKDLPLKGVFEGMGGFEFAILMQLSKLEPTINVEQMLQDAGLSAEQAKIAAEKTGAAASFADQVRMIQTHIKRAGFRAHFTPSKEVGGFEGNLERPFADYVMGLSNHLAKRRFVRDAAILQKRIPSHKGRLKQYAQQYVEYLASPPEEWGWVRGMMFHFYLGNISPLPPFISPNVRAPLVNLSQIPMMSYPWLAQYAPDATVANELRKAYRDVTKTIGATRRQGRQVLVDFDKLPADVREDAKKSIADGTLQSQMMDELAGLARAKTKAGRAAHKVSGAFFQASEEINRVVTFVAAHRIYRSKRPKASAVTARKSLRHGAFLADFASPLEFAEDVVNKTQLEYARYNRPELFRGRKSVLFVFKSFTVGNLELQQRLWNSWVDANETALTGGRSGRPPRTPGGPPEPPSGGSGGDDGPRLPGEEFDPIGPRGPRSKKWWQKNAWLRMLWIQFMASGVNGLWYMGEFLAAATVAWGIFHHDEVFDFENEINLWLQERTGPQIADAVMYGAPQAFEFTPDLHYSLSMGEPLGLGGFARTGAVSDAIPVAQLPGRIGESFLELFQGENWADGLATALRRFGGSGSLPAISKAMEASREGLRTGRPTSTHPKGKQLELPGGRTELTPFELVEIAAGFTPTSVSKARRHERSIQLADMAKAGPKAYFLKRLKRAWWDGDSETFDRIVQQEIPEWNKGRGGTYREIRMDLRKRSNMPKAWEETIDISWDDIAGIVKTETEFPEQRQLKDVRRSARPFVEQMQQRYRAQP